MKIIELIIDEKEDLAGVDAISVVEFPAIEENFIALNQELQLAKVDDEKRILIGAALIPNKNIYRRNGDDEYYIFFSEDTVRKASELFLMNSNQNNTTLEHDKKLKDLTVVESWIVEDVEMDKSKKYGLNAPVGTWMVTMKVNNDTIWNDFVKTGKVKGFSIEGYFADKLEMSLQKEKEQELLNKIKDIILNGEKKNYLSKISFDYDSTLSTKKGTEIAKRLIAENNDLYIISARHLKSGMINKAKELGIPLNRVYATGSNTNKILKIKSLNIKTHYDNNENVIKQIQGIGKLFKND